MKDDDSLASLGRLAREEETVTELEQRLLRLAKGELSDSEITDLENDAGAEAVLAHRPLDSEFKQGVEQRLAALLPAEPAAKVVPLRPRWVLPSAAALVVAAAAMLLFFLNGPTETALPGYELALSGGAEEIRGATTQPITIVSGSRLTLLVRPSTSTSEPVTAFAFLRSPAGLLPIKSQPQVSSSGSIKLDVLEADLPRDTGSKLGLVVVVGKTSALSSSDAASSLAQRGSGRDYQVLEASVRRGK